MSLERCLVSVVVAAQEGEADPAACLESLANQEGIEPESLEVILVDGRLDQGTEGDCETSGLTVIPASGRPSLPELLGQGILRCRGDLVALTESHTRFPPDWARNARVVHQETGAVAIGGAVKSGDLRGQLDWSLYLVDYATFVPPFEARETDDLPGCNVLFERGVLPDRDEMSAKGFWKTIYCRQLAQSGEKLWLDPRMAVLYNRRRTMPEWMRRRWMHGRCFGGMRAENLPPMRRFLIAVLAPTLPPVLVLRVWRRLRGKEGFRRRFLTAFLSVFLAETIWMAGEWVGNLLGPGNSCLEV